MIKRKNDQNKKDKNKIGLRRFFMKKQNLLRSALVVVLITGVITGAYAYFTAKKQITVNARSAQFGIEVQPIDFTEVDNMIPGDSKEFSFAVKNSGQRPVKAFTEIRVTSEVPLSNELMWNITEQAVASTANKVAAEQIENGDPGSILEEKTFREIMDGGVQFISLSQDTKTATFLVPCGELFASKDAGTDGKISEKTIRFFLNLATNAPNDFIEKSCSVTANVFAVQSEHLDDSLAMDTLGAYFND